MDPVTSHFADKGDLAHLALFVWASGASFLLARVLGELAAERARLDALLRALAEFNRALGPKAEPAPRGPEGCPLEPRKPAGGKP